MERRELVKLKAKSQNVLTKPHPEVRAPSCSQLRPFCREKIKLGLGEVVQLAQHLPCEPGDLDSDTQRPHKKLDTVESTCNLSTGEAESRGSQACWPVSPARLVNSRFRERPCLKKSLRKTSIIPFWLLHACTQASTHKHMDP